MTPQPSTALADRLNISISTSITRRGALRFLAAAVVGGAGIAGPGSSAIDAKRKRRKHRKGGGSSKAICGRGGHAVKLELPNDGTVVETPVLAAGHSYRLRVSGVVTGVTSTQAEVGIDAGYRFANRANSIAFTDSFGDLDYGVSVDGGPANWGDFTTTHVYERVVNGNGAKLALRFTALPAPAAAKRGLRRIITEDPDLDLTLDGELTVEIHCA